MNNQIEKIDEKALFAMINSVRSQTWEAVEAIKNMIVPGMTEKDAIKKANVYFANQGVKKFWHKTHIRFGESTILGFDDPYNENVVLKENDIFYIDIGPIWDGVEGDCGDTFVMGENKDYTAIKMDVKFIFDEVSFFWKKTNSTGKKLYEYFMKISDKMGYKIHPSYVKGHRLSEFSHSIYSNLGVFDLDFTPHEERWVLELQICHPSMKFGAFYEDILI